MKSYRAKLGAERRRQRYRARQKAKKAFLAQKYEAPYVPFQGSTELEKESVLLEHCRAEARIEHEKQLEQQKESEEPK